MSLECPCCGVLAFEAGAVVCDGDPSPCGCAVWVTADAETGPDIAWDDTEECIACAWVHDRDSEAARAARGVDPDPEARTAAASQV